MKAAQIVNQALTSQIYQHVAETPLSAAPMLSASLGAKLWLKREDLHPIFSFKIRGALHKMLNLGHERCARGVVAASAGNHAQGVAYASRLLGAPATIYMPTATPSIKVNAVRRLGAQVVLEGEQFKHTLAQARKFCARRKQVFIHPFDDDEVICGQATVGAELLREMPPTTEAVFVACGGGGLLAGVAAMVKQLRPKVKVFGVEPVDAACMALSLKRGRAAKLDYVGTFAETVAVERPGTRTFRICKQLVDGVRVIDTGAICNAIKDIYEETRVIVEPAGALSLAGAQNYVGAGEHKGGDLVAVVCGANMNFDALRYVIERSASGEGGEMLLAAKIPDKPGSFLRLCKLLGKRHVREFNYRFSHTSSQAHIFAGLSIKDESERGRIIDNLAKHKIEAVDLTGDETAELHVRHMVGGRAQTGEQELLYRIEFPERAQALVYFLSKIKTAWNISLFHYRFHGADVGRVLIGFQLPESKRGALERTFKEIGYPFWPVRDNPSCNMFLADPLRQP